jgi:hypothetical protein
VGRAIELRKARLDQDADSVPVREEGNTTTTIIASGFVRSCVSENPRTLRNNVQSHKLPTQSGRESMV